MNKKRSITRAVELMRRFHLGREEELARQYPYTLSGGMRQRALIAMGISADAELLLFDEPTKGLDEARIRLVADTLNELDRQTMVCVTHDLSFARDVANRIGVMYAANLIEVADADELYAHPLHPYTKMLLSAIPLPDPIAERNKKRPDYSAMKFDTEGQMVEVTPGHFVLQKEGGDVSEEK